MQSNLCLMIVLLNDLLFGSHDARAPLVVGPSVCLEHEKLAHLLPEANRRTDERLLVRIDHRPLPDEVDLVRLDKLGLLQELPENEERRNEELHGVVGEEAGHGPGEIGGVAVVAGGDEHPAGAEVGAVGLEVAFVGEQVAVEALGLAGAVEADVGNGHDGVVDET